MRRHPLLLSHQLRSRHQPRRPLRLPSLRLNHRGILPSRFFHRSADFRIAEAKFIKSGMTDGASRMHFLKYQTIQPVTASLPDSLPEGRKSPSEIAWPARTIARQAAVGVSFF